jgi:hypothetical protein
MPRINESQVHEAAFRGAKENGVDLDRSTVRRNTGRGEDCIQMEAVERGEYRRAGGTSGTCRGKMIGMWKGNG